MKNFSIEVELSQSKLSENKLPFFFKKNNILCRVVFFFFFQQFMNLLSSVDQRLKNDAQRLCSKLTILTK